MKKQLLILLSLLIVALPIQAADDNSGNQEDKYEFQYEYPANSGVRLTYTPLTANTAQVIFHANYLNLEDVEIPEKVTDSNGKEYTVTSIGQIAFESCKSLKRVKVPATVKVINKYAFANSKAPEIILSEGLETIEDYAFENSGVINLVIPKTVTRLEPYAISNCVPLESVHIANPAIFIGPHCFEGSCMKKVTFGENTPEFQGKKGRISEWAFAHCEHLQSIKIPDNMPAIGSYAFAYCAKQTIQDLLYGCLYFNDKNEDYTNFIKSMIGMGLEHLDLGSGVTEIGDHAFYSCRLLGDIIIPDQVKTIGDYAFADCSLAHINRPEIFRIALGKKNREETTLSIYTLCVSIGEKTEPEWFTDDVHAKYNEERDGFEPVGYKKQVFPIKLQIGSGVTTIGAHAFENCRRLDEIVIPDNVTSLGEYAFAGCYRYIDYACIKFEDDYYIPCYGVQKISIGKGLTEIPAHAFENCKALPSIVIPDNIKKIGAYAFRGCSYAPFGTYTKPYPDSVAQNGGLKDINFGTGVTEIGDYAFAECQSLEHVEIPDNVTTIGAYAFSDSRYTYYPVLYVLGIDNEMDNFSKYNEQPYHVGGEGAGLYTHLMKGLRSITIGNGVTRIGNGAFARSKWLEKVTFGSAVQYIGDGAFENCKSLKTISLPDCAFGADLFRGSGVEILTIPPSCTEINAKDYLICEFINQIEVEEGNTAFKVENGLLMSFDGKTVVLAPKNVTDVTLPAGTEKIAPYAFANCKNLTSVTFNDGLTTVGDHIFEGCEKLDSVSLPESIHTIGDYAFNGLSNVKFSKLPDSVRTIGDYAFAGCSAATFEWDSQKIPQHLETIGEHAFDGCAESKFGPFSDALKSIGAYAFKDCKKMNALTYGDYEFDDTAFEGCEKEAKTLFIGKNISNLSDLSRFDGMNITNIEFDQENSDYKFATDGNNSYILSKDKTTLLWAVIGADNKDAVIPQSVTTIGAHAFDHKGTILTLKIHEGVTTIGDYAFHDCSFNGIEGGEGVTTVGAYAFEGAGVKKLNLSTPPSNSIFSFGKLFDNLTTIGDYAFSNVGFIDNSVIYTSKVSPVSLYYKTDVYLCFRSSGANLGKKVTSMGTGAFKGTHFADQELVIPATITEVPDSAFAELSRKWNKDTIRVEKFTLKIEEGVKKIGAYSFAKAFDLLDKVNIIITKSGATVSNVGNPEPFSVTLPQSIEEFGPSAFMGCTGFGAINIPRKVTELSDNLFEGCSNLASIDYSRAKITRIGKEALKGCSALTSLTLPNTLTVIDDGAFMDCTGLTEIVVPASVTKISADAFRGCTNLKKITLPDKLIEISDRAFMDCTALSEIVFPKSLESLGTEAFANCTSLPKEIVLPDELNFIGEDAFAGLSQLEKITFGKRVGTISKEAFADLTGLKQLSFGGSVGTIEEDAFKGCPITELEFGSDVDAIGDRAFKGMTGLTKVTFGKSVGAIGKEAFMNCSSLAQPLVLQGTKIVDDRAFSGCSKITSIDFGNALTTIGQYAFDGCSAIDSIHFSATVTDIDDTAFEGCTAISKVSYDAELLNEFTEYLFPEEIYGHANPAAENGTQVNQTTFYAPNSTLVEAVMTAPWNRFYRLVCKDGEVSHTTASDKIEDGGIGLEFGKLTDNYCEVVGTTTKGKDLKKITVPEKYVSKGVTYTVIQIGREAFMNHKNLEEIELPQTLLSISNGAFQNCKLLEEIELPQTLLTIGSSAFQGCERLEDINLPDGVYRIGASAFEGCHAITRMNIPKPVTEIADSVFKDCQGLLEIKLHGNLTAIGAKAFENCTHLHEFLVPGEMNLTTLGARAFYNCNDLISLDISESVDFIGESAFENCSKLDDVKLPSSLKKIENRAFANCDRLANIEIGDLVTEIGDSAFYDCARINEVKIPVAVTKVGIGAFDRCPELTTIYLYSGDADLLGKQTFSNPDCHIFVQTKDFDNYQETWEKSLYVASQYEQSNIKVEDPRWTDAVTTVEVSQDTQPGDRIIAAITMSLDKMFIKDEHSPVEKTVDEEYNKEGYYNEDYGNKNLHRYYPGASASYLTVAPVAHEHEYWSSKEERVATTVDGPGNFIITGVGPGIVRVETENYYYHDYDVKIYPQRSDANWDGDFDISDAVNIANHVVKKRDILSNWATGNWMGEKNWEHFYLPGADVNGDGDISVSDASAAVKVALKQEPKEAARNRARAAYNYGDALIIGTAEDGTIPVGLDNSIEYVALQANIRVPEGMTLENVKAGKRAAGHTLSSRRIDDRTMRVVLFDFNNSAFAEADLPLLELMVNGDNITADEVEIFDIVASDIASNSYALTSRGKGSSTGVGTALDTDDTIHSTEKGLLITNAKGKHIAVYTVDGRIIKSFTAASDAETITLAKGIYIVTVENNSSKIAIK